MPTAALFGAAVKRVEDPRFLVAKTTYVESMKLAGMCGVAFVRSPHAHARIRSIDVGKASTHPGVVKVLTGEECARLCKPIRVEWDADLSVFDLEFKACDFPAIAEGRVRFVGDIVAAVVAEDRYVAEDGVELVEVDYEPLPAAVDPDKALDEGAPLLQSGLNIDPIITHHFAVDDYLEGFELMSSGQSGKIILNWA